MLNYHRVFLFLARSLLLLGFSQSTVAITGLDAVVIASDQLKPQKITSRLQLANLLMTHHTNRYNALMAPDAMDVTATDNNTAPIALSTAATIAHSVTPTQVQGIDEADTVKVADDGYIYQIYNNKVAIIKGVPVSLLNQTATITFPENSGFYATELYVQNNNLVVLGTVWKNLDAPQTDASAKKALNTGVGNQYAQTRMLIYDISNHAAPIQIRDLAVDGDYLDSRRIGDDVYFITRTYPMYYMYGDQASLVTMTLGNMLPNIAETKAGKMTKKTIALADVTYFPGFVEPDYLTISSINLQYPNKAPITKAYFGAGEMIYASTKNLYITASRSNFGVDNTMVNVAAGTTTTQIFKFAIQSGAINFVAANEINGTVHNTFSMDEEGDYFRIATTEGINNGTSSLINTLFVLDKNMNIVGKLDDLAKGEQIYAARFLGARCYLETFKTVDPLITIDLSNPEKPTVMGQLKIPGYSNYLHPYDETHLIGFGKNAVIYSDQSNQSDRSWTGGAAFYQGLKVTLFDVADMKKPKELHSITVGDRGTSSPLLWDHKALYWNAERHLIGFPVEIYTLSTGFNTKQPWQYGLPTYQGAYIYEVTPEKGFKLAAQLSQIPVNTKPYYEKIDGIEYSYWQEKEMDLFVERLFDIGDNVYTLSNAKLNVYDSVTYKEQTYLELKP